jgi:hypothetical protein
MESNRLARRIALFSGAVVIVATGALTGCGSKGTETPSTTTTTTTTTTPTTTVAPPPPASPTEKMPPPTNGNQFTPAPVLPGAPPQTTHRQREYPY